MTLQQLQQQRILKLTIEDLRILKLLVDYMRYVADDRERALTPEMLNHLPELEEKLSIFTVPGDFNLMLQRLYGKEI